jgi:hypothetical protein
MESGQQDSQEFFNNVLHYIIDKVPSSDRLRAAIEFRHRSHHSARFGDEEIPKDETQPGFFFSLDINIYQNLAEALTHMRTHEEAIPNWETNRGRLPAIRTQWFVSVGTVFMLHLQLAQNNGDQTSKQSVVITCPETLNITNYMEDQSQPEDIFDIFGMITHVGHLSSGHFAAYLRIEGRPAWTKFSDARVFNDEAPSDRETPYLVFYRRRADSGRSRPVVPVAPAGVLERYLGTDQTTPPLTPSTSAANIEFITEGSLVPTKFGVEPSPLTKHVFNSSPRWSDIVHKASTIVKGRPVRLWKWETRKDRLPFQFLPDGMNGPLGNGVQSHTLFVEELDEAPRGAAVESLVFMKFYTQDPANPIRFLGLGRLKSESPVRDLFPTVRTKMALGEEPLLVFREDGEKGICMQLAESDRFRSELVTPPPSPARYTSEVSPSRTTPKPLSPGPPPGRTNSDPIVQSASCALWGRAPLSMWLVFQTLPGTPLTAKLSTAEVQVENTYRNFRSLDKMVQVVVGSFNGGDPDPRPLGPFPGIAFYCHELRPELYRRFGIQSSNPAALMFYSDDFLHSGKVLDEDKPLNDRSKVFVRVVKHFCRPVIESTVSLEIWICPDGEASLSSLSYWIAGCRTVRDLLEELRDEGYIRRTAVCETYWLRQSGGSQRFSAKPCQLTDAVAGDSVLKIDDFGDEAPDRDPSAIRLVSLVDERGSHPSAIPRMFPIHGGRNWAATKTDLGRLLQVSDRQPASFSCLAGDAVLELRDNEVPFTRLPPDAMIIATGNARLSSAGSGGVPRIGSRPLRTASAPGRS